MSGFHDNVLLGASGSQGYQISRSVRLRSSASAYFNRTLTTPTDGKKWTYSVWVKRGILTAGTGTAQQLLSAGSATAFFRFSTTDTLVSGWTGAANLETTQVFRDPSAWYHIMLVVDTTQATASNRVKYYVNGTQITAFATTDYPTQNSTTTINSAVAHNIGAYTSSTQYLDGYLTEVNFIDGQALTPSSFGETNTVTGVWQPKKYAGTYGTNGFYLNFSDNSAATAAAIGKDYSGNGNNWTPNNISVTAGVTYDSMLDVPTQWADGGNGRGNYCVLSPLDYATAAPTNGNLTLTNGFARATMAIPSTGKWYWENTIGSSSNNACGLSPASSSVSDANGGSGFYAYYIGGTKYTAGSSSAYGASYTSGDVIGVAVDSDAGTVTFYKNNVSQGVAFSGLSFASPWLPLARPITSATTDINFGQRPFAYTPPTGFKALNTLNLPTPTILKGNQYFDATTYTGNASTNTIVNAGGFQPDLVWLKSRSAANNHTLFDSVRGANNILYPNLTNAAAAVSQYLNSFNSNGFTLGANENSNDSVGESSVGWQWKEGATQGFDIVTYTGNGTAGRTISHSLGVAPAMMIMKSRSNARTWPVYHKNLTSAAYYIGLETTNQQLVDNTMFNSTAPTSSVFTVGTYQNANAETYVAYLFAEVAGFSKFGSYTGNGSTDGPFVFLGFRPRFVLIKESSAAGNNWVIYDTARDTYNECSNILYPNLSNAEFSGSTVNLDILSNGFKPRDNWGGNNTNGSTYIYAAFAENPFKNALAR